MTTDTKAVVRAQFEAWARMTYTINRGIDGRYLNVHTGDAWDAWQASLAASRAEVEELKSKAARYDWIRMNAVLDGANGDQFDAEIDAAMENNNV
jgi:hypothetical protein